MVPREISETSYRKTDSVDSPEFERVTGHLHRHRVDTAFHHHREQALKRGSLRCGQHTGHNGGGHIGVGDPYSHGTDQSRCPARGKQSGLDQIRGGGFTGGTGDSQHRNAIRRVPVDIGGQCPEHRTRRGMDHHRHRRGIDTEQATDHRHTVGISEHRDSAGLDCGRGVLCPVHRRPGQCREQVADSCILGAQGDTANADIRHARGTGGRWSDPGRTWADPGRHRADPGGQCRQRQAGCRARPQGTRQRTPPLVSRPSDRPFTLPSRRVRMP